MFLIKLRFRLPQVSAYLENLLLLCLISATCWLFMWTQSDRKQPHVCVLLHTAQPDRVNSFKTAIASLRHVFICWDKKTYRHKDKKQIQKKIHLRPVSCQHFVRSLFFNLKRIVKIVKKKDCHRNEHVTYTSFFLCSYNIRLYFFTFNIAF